MKNLFNLDSPIIIFMTNLTDVIILNLLCIVCCIPVVTIGASVTAMHYMTLKMARGEDGYIVRGFFKAFKDNFKQSTIIWLIFLAITAVIVMDFRILNLTGIEQADILKIVISAIYLFICVIMMYVFPVLARFDNTIRNTVRNAMFMSIIHLFKTILMAVIYVAPFLLIPLHINMILVFLFVGLAGPAYINSYLWKGIFKKYEPEEETDEHLDEVLTEENEVSSAHL